MLRLVSTRLIVLEVQLVLHRAGRILLHRPVILFRTAFELFEKLSVVT